MLDPDVVLAAVVSAFQDIPEVVSAMGDPNHIYGHSYSAGTENSLARALFEMTSPSILVTYLDILGGNFDGMTVWKHRIEAYIRPENANTGGMSMPHVAWLMMNKPLASMGGGGHRLRDFSLLSGSLLPMETPSLMHRTDETLADYFCWSMVFPEEGDQ